MKKFKYTLKKDPIDIEAQNFLEDYLKKLGIKKVKSFIDEPSPVDEEPSILLDNIDKLTEELHKAFQRDDKFFMQVDSDTDGYTSAAIFYNYFKKLYPEAKIEYRMHEEKEHGVIVDKVPLDTNIVIIPDAGTNQIEEQIELVQRGMKVLIMDHHLPDKFEEVDNVIVVNNQLSKKFKNKDLSGAGVVYKVIQYYSKLYSDGEDYKEFTDLAALGIISDMMDTRNLDNNYIIYHGLRNVKSRIFEAMLYHQEYSITSVYRPNKIDIAFYITPMINGVIRAGSDEDKLLLFKAFIDNTRGREVYEREYQGKLLRENFYEMVARTCANIRERQNRTKEDTMNFIDSKLQDSEALDHSVILAITSKDDEIVVPKTMTGLVAMEILKKYGKPTLVVRPKVIKGQNYLFGSGRASSVEGFDSFKAALEESEYTYFAQGHDNAFGFGIREEDVDLFLQDMDERLKDFDFESDTIEVDYIFSNSNIHQSVLRTFAECMPIYGNGIAQPKFAFELLLTPGDFKIMGQNRDVVKIDYKNLEFINFRAKELADFLENKSGKLLKVELIGRSQFNEFRGSKTLQVVVDYIKIKNAELTALL